MKKRITFLILGFLLIIFYEKLLISIFNIFGDLNFEITSIKLIVLSIFLVLIGLLYPFKDNIDKK